MATDPVAARLNESERRKLQAYMDAEGYERPSDGVRNALVLGLETWHAKHDPAQSWLLNVGLAAMLWAILAVVGSVRIGTPPWNIAAFSVWMAFVFLTAHAVQLARIRWNGRSALATEASDG